MAGILYVCSFAIIYIWKKKKDIRSKLLKSKQDLYFISLNFTKKEKLYKNKKTF